MRDCILVFKGFSGGAEVKASACNVGDLGSIWMKTSIQLPLILKFCDSLKCTLGMTASVSIKLQF